MPQRYARTFPVDWREKLLAVLTSEGVTQPAYVARWKLVLADVGKIAGWFLLAAGFIGIVLLVGQVLVYFRFSDDVDALILLPLLFIGWPLLLILVIWPRAQRLARRLRVDIWVGRSPAHALRAAKHPPVLYLRSFSFDNLSSPPSKWL